MSASTPALLRRRQALVKRVAQIESVSQAGGRPEMDYVPEEYSQQVSHYLQNFQKVRQVLEQICNINRELLRRRVKF